MRFKEMMDEALATAMSDDGGVGLADLGVKEPEAHPEAAKARDPIDEWTALKFRSTRSNL